MGDLGDDVTLQSGLKEAGKKPVIIDMAPGHVTGPATLSAGKYVRVSIAEKEKGNNLNILIRN